MTQFRKMNQFDMPAIGLGTSCIGEWQLDDAFVTQTVREALDLGYRYIDTASMYGNERSIGEAIRQSGLPRSEIFVGTKAWYNELGFDGVQQACRRSLERLQLEYVDLLMIHFPLMDADSLLDTWRGMEECVKQGIAKHLGVCNFRIEDLRTLLDAGGMQPIANQVELHPYYQQLALREFCHQHAIQLVSWGPLGTGLWTEATVDEKPISDPLFTEIAAELAVTPAQVMLRWHHQLGLIPTPKSQAVAHLRDNLHIFDFELTDDQMQRIAKLDKQLCFGPDLHNFATTYEALRQATPPH